jgi:hypothetical protein
MATASNAASIDTATLELLAGWRLQDATDNPADARAAERELAEFRKTIDETRRTAAPDLAEGAAPVRCND